MRDRGRFQGCLLGGAAGDALGFEVEFLPEEMIFERFGESGITGYVLHNGVAEISDDTQMTLFTATGLLVGTNKGKTCGMIGKYEDCIRNSYKDWFLTQTRAFPLRDGYHHSWLVNIPQLFNRRAPGTTCITALEEGRQGTTKHPVNRSKGCGGIMRVAPIGLYFCDKTISIEETDRLGAEAAAITHGHDLGWLPAAALVHIIRRLSETEGETILSAVFDSIKTLGRLYPESEHLYDLVSLMQKAISLSRENWDDLDAIHQLGKGWVAEETLAIAIYCALKYPNDFESALIAAVNHGGDSDSTGAVTGNIVGAFLGIEGIPKKFLDNLELRRVIEEIADDLFYDCKLSENRDYRDPVWDAKYNRMNYSL